MTHRTIQPVVEAQARDPIGQRCGIIERHQVTIFAVSDEAVRPTAAGRYWSEFVARAILRWLSTANIETAYIDPGKPWQNAAGENFNGKFRDERLSLSGSTTGSMRRS